jgi:hypothetical protein
VCVFVSGVFGLARKLTLSFNGRPSASTRGKAQALSHETTIAKANAAATSCWLEQTLPEYDKKVTAGFKKKHVYRSEDVTWWLRCKGSGAANRV